jgi:heme-degrading monooxygenase HmoA
VWTDRAAFEAWMRSDAFTQGHRAGGSMMGVLQGPPEAKMYEAVIVERSGQE